MVESSAFVKVETRTASKARQLAPALKERDKEIIDLILQGGGKILLPYGKAQVNSTEAAAVAGAVRMRTNETLKNVPEKARNDYLMFECTALPAGEAKKRGWPTSGEVNYFEVTVKVHPQFWIYKNSDEPERVFEIIGGASQSLEESEKGLFKRRISASNPERIAASLVEILKGKITVAYDPESVREKDGKKSYTFTFYNVNVAALKGWLSENIDKAQEYGVPQKTPELANLTVAALLEVVKSDKRLTTALQEGRLIIESRGSTVVMKMALKPEAPAAEEKPGSEEVKAPVKAEAKPAIAEAKLADAVVKEAVKIERAMQAWVGQTGPIGESKTFTCTKDTLAAVMEFANGMWSVQKERITLSSDEGTATITLTRGGKAAVKPAEPAAPTAAAPKREEKPAAVAPKPTVKPAAPKAAAPAQLDEVFQPLLKSLNELDPSDKQLANQVISAFKRLNPDNKKRVVDSLKELSEEQPEWYKSTFQLNQLLTQIGELEKPKSGKR